MEPFDREELSPQELDELLEEWRAPAPPAHLRAALFPEETRPWWRRIWTVSVRVPLPVACCLAVLLAAAVWRTAWPAPASKPTVVAPAERREVPVEPDRTAASKLAAAHGLTFNELRPVDELRPRIIRRKNAKN